MSEYYGAPTTPMDDYLAHYGVKGMKWGVRRYLNRSGELTPRGMARYGPKSEKKTSAFKIQRDFNKLDQSFANVHANEVDANDRLAKYVRKAAKHTIKMSQKGYDPKSAAKLGVEKYAKKIKKTKDQIKEYKDQQAGIESLQNRVVGHAARQGYTVSSRPIKRLGQSNKDRRAALTGALMVGGALGGAVYGGISAAQGLKNGKTVDGQQLRVRKNGDGSIKLTNYYNMNHPGESKKKKNK